jgi:hypothetical protein
MRCDSMKVFQLGETPGSQLLAPGTGFFLHARAFEFLFIFSFFSFSIYKYNADIIIFKGRNVGIR